LPEIIGEALWLSVDEAVKQINISHINYFIKDISKFPNTIRSGTVERFDNNGELVSKISENFYNINEH
jgi:hypothetical protein